MLPKLLLIFFYFIAPAILIWLEHKFIMFRKVGTVLWAYAIGLVIGNIGLLNNVESLFELQDTLNSVVIPLAIPMLLFSLNIKQWFTMAWKSFLAMVLGIGAVVIMVFAANSIFSSSIADSWKIGGLLVGVYSGGTPNLAALQSALNVNADVYIMINTIDIILSSIFLLFFISIGRKFLGLFLKPYSKEKTADQFDADSENYSGIFKLSSLKDVGVVLMLSVLILSISVGLSFLIAKSISMLVVILSLTTLGILASLVKRINLLKYSYQIGMYFILVFCVVVASMADINEIMNIAGSLLLYITFVLFGSVILHIVLAKIFKIDVDTLMVTSTALICSPPFVPVVAGAIKNRYVIVSGLTVGIVGYALGNYLGVTIAFLLK